LTTHHSAAIGWSTFPLTTGALLDKLCPLILDGSSSVRIQSFKLLQVLPSQHVQDHVPKLLPHIRAGLTHLSRDVRLSSIDVLSWLTGTAGGGLVSCAGGWYKTLECFTTLLAWTSSDIGKWTTSKPSLGDSRSAAKVITVLAEFLEVGLLDTSSKENVHLIADAFPLWQTYHHQLPTKSNAYSYLNLFGPPQDAKNQMLEDREDRLRIYSENFRPLIEAGMTASKKEGGELGRATGLLSKVLDRARLDETYG
jgi:pre-rRNA-processing protein IPI1